MNLLHLWRPLALMAAFALLTADGHADLITPNSIPNPPAAVHSADGTPILSMSNPVTTQYTGLGLNFSNSGESMTVLTALNGLKVWAPAIRIALPLLSGQTPRSVATPVGRVHYSGEWAGAGFVVPGTLKPTTASSLSVEIVGNPQAGVFVNYAPHPGIAIPASFVVGPGPHGGRLYTFLTSPGVGIRSFQVDAIPPPNDLAWNPAWGVAEVSFTLSHAPEPGSLLLAGLGALGLAAHSSWRRVWPGKRG